MRIFLTLAGAIMPVLGLAEVVDKSPAGFQVRHVQTIAGTPEKVFGMLLQVGTWWDSAHTYSGDARNMTLEAKPGGCFCEKLPNQGGVQHMTVAFIAPPTTLRLIGGLGPLQESGIAGSMTFVLKPADGGTQVTLTYNAGGYYKGGLDAMAAIVDQVVGEQLAHLKSAVAGKAELKPVK